MLAEDVDLYVISVNDPNLPNGKLVIPVGNDGQLNDTLTVDENLKDVNLTSDDFTQ